MHLVDDVQKQVGDLVRSVRAVGQQAAEVDVGEIGVGAAFGGRHPDLGRRGMVVELDEKGFQQFPRLLVGKRAVGKALPIERQQVLIEVAGIERIPAVQLGDYRQMAEPVVLQGLVKIARRMGRHVRADIGDFFQFGFADRIGLR